MLSWHWLSNGNCSLQPTQKCATSFDVRAPSGLSNDLLHGNLICKKSLYDHHFVLCIPDCGLMKTRFKPLTLWKFQSRPEVCYTLLVLRQTTVRLRMIRLIEMHSSKQYTDIPSPDKSSTFKKPGHNSCARSSTWLNGSHCGQRSSNSNSQPREVTPNGVAMHQIPVGCVEKKHISESELQFVRNPRSIERLFPCRQVTYLFFLPEGGKCNSPKTFTPCDKPLTSHIKSTLFSYSLITSNEDLFELKRHTDAEDWRCLCKGRHPKTLGDARCYQETKRRAQSFV